MAADRRERGAQLVRDGHQEAALALLGLLQPGRHLAEAVGEVGDLVAAANLRDGDVVAPAGDLVRRCGQLEHRLRDPAREVPAERSGHDQPDPEGDRQALHQTGQPRGDDGLRRRDDQGAEDGPLRTQPERVLNREVGAREARRSELEGARRLPLPVGEQPLLDDSQPRRVEEHGRADVEDPVPGRLLELAPRDAQGLAPLVVRRLRLQDEELRQPCRLATEVRHLLVACEALEELDGDRRGDDAADDDPRQEERGQAEPERGAHDGRPRRRSRRRRQRRGLCPCRV